MLKFPPHISLNELTRSQTATRQGIDNSPDEQIKSNLLQLAWFLELLREKIRETHPNAVLIISSGYRCEELNFAIGGSKTSSHMFGFAGDIRCPDLTPLELSIFIRDNMDDYDQIIHEFSSWVHVSICSGLPRYETLTAMKENGRTVYKKGLI